jgi:LPXTG-site transpeptidase (sortase) family protein
MRGSAHGPRAIRGRRARRPLATTLLVTGLVLLGASAAGLAWASQTGRPAAATGTAPRVPVPQGHVAAAPAAMAAPVRVAKPVSLTIPAIGVQTRLVRLGLAADGTLQVPSTTAVAGWYTGSPRPGDAGAAVIAGHVDSYAGPGVFFRLRLLQPGDRVYVRRADGSLAVFRVTDVRMYAKTHFPTVSVYGAVPDAELRLITCGGTFDAATGHYLSNVIVFAALVSSRPG